MVLGIAKIQQALLAMNHIESRTNAKPSGCNGKENLFAIKNSEENFAYAGINETISNLKTKNPNGKTRGHNKHANKTKANSANNPSKTVNPARGGDKLQQAMEIASQFFQQSGKTDLANTLQNSKVVAGNLQKNTLGQYDGKQITISAAALQNETPEKIASIIAHETSHANDRDETSSLVEERDNFMLGEELLDAYGKGEFNENGAKLANKLDGLIAKAYASQNLDRTSTGHTGAIIYNA